MEFPRPEYWMEWVAIPFSRGSSQPKDQTQVSHIAGGFFNQLSHQGMPLKQIIKLRYRSNLPKITLLKVGGLRIEAQVR